MSQHPLHPVLYEKFTKAFGEAHRVVGKDWQWGLRTISYAAPINILINGSSEHPLVWVFDPHDPTDGVASHRIEHESQIDPLIKSIEVRVKTVPRPR